MMRALIAELFLVACAAPDAPAQPDAQTPAPTPPVTETAPPAPALMALTCSGAFTQGGVALCRTVPDAEIFVDGVASGTADDNGWAVIGFTREHGARAQVQARAGGESTVMSYDIAAREFDIQRVDGL